MKEVVEALRGPALGVILMIILIGGVVVITAFAALIAQMGLLLRMRSQMELRPQQVAPAAERERRSETPAWRYSARKRRLLGGRIKP